ncbi:MAG: Rpn family recombination-promoting nuclease/putative transposase [Bacteroidota bacterium]
MKRPYQAHDHFFKILFSEPNRVRSYLKAHLPQKWFNRLAWQDLQLDSNSYTDEQLREYLTDVVYQCPLRDSQEKINMVFLFEHKSYLPTFPHLQLLRYMLNLWEYQAKNSKRLQPIVPMLIYHGTANWRMRPFHEYLAFGTDPWIRQFVPDFAYHLTSLRRETAEDIEQQYEEVILRKGFLLMKYTFDPELSNYLERIFEAFSSSKPDEQQSQLFRIFIRYLSNSPQSQSDQIMEKMKSLVEEWGLEEGSAAELWYTQGMEKGVQLSIEKMLLKGFEVEVIAEILEISPELVEEVSNRLTNEG